MNTESVYIRYILPFKYALILKITDHNVCMCDVVLGQCADGRF